MCTVQTSSSALQWGQILIHSITAGVVGLGEWKKLDHTTCGIDTATDMTTASQKGHHSRQPRVARMMPAVNWNRSDRKWKWDLLWQQQLAYSQNKTSKTFASSYLQLKTSDIYDSELTVGIGSIATNVYGVKMLLHKIRRKGIHQGFKNVGRHSTQKF